MSPAPGVSFGPYQVVEQFRSGGMATIYRAYQPALSRYVAIKVLPPSMAGEAGFPERFRQEAVAIARLRHPNILSVFDYGEEGGLPYLVMEFVDGGDLGDQMGVPLPVSYAVSMLAPIAAALDYAHEQGVLHRDVKPHNVLLHRGGTPVLADFGIAKLADSGQRLTRTGVVLGTPEYMAPEQAMGLAAVAASDQYALAVIAYEMLTGRVPFSADTPMAVLIAQVQQPLPSPRSVNPALNRDVEEVLLRGLAKRPQDRYQNISAFTAALALAGRVATVFAVGTSAQAPPPPEPLRLGRGLIQNSPRRALPLLVAVAIVVAVLLALFFYRTLARPGASLTTPVTPQHVVAARTAGSVTLPGLIVVATLPFSDSKFRQGEFTVAELDQSLSVPFGQAPDTLRQFPRP